MIGFIDENENFGTGSTEPNIRLPPGIYKKVKLVRQTSNFRRFSSLERPSRSDNNPSDDVFGWSIELSRS
jgi:hypothetical protein